MSTINIVLVLLGLVSVAVFGLMLYNSYAHGGVSGLSGIADASGLIVGLVVLILGTTAKI
jgi:hypothetical protein